VSIHGRQAAMSGNDELHQGGWVFTSKGVVNSASGDTIATQCMSTTNLDILRSLKVQFSTWKDKVLRRLTYLHNASMAVVSAPLLYN